MKVASFNVNSIRARLHILTDWLKKENPDSICIQETKVTDDKFPKDLFTELGYFSVFRGERSYNGIAILSKTPIEDVKIGFDEQESEGSRLITAKINNITIINTYIPQGFDPLSEKFQYKLEWLHRLYDYFNNNFDPEIQFLWLGDFNVAPEPIDVYDPERLIGHVCYHHDEHKALNKIKQWGFIDIFRLHRPEVGQYTFWDYRVPNAFKRKMGWRVDHIWATKLLAERSTNAWIDVAPRLLEKPSDHTVIVAEFEI